LRNPTDRYYNIPDEKLDESGKPYRVSYLPEIELSRVFCKEPCGIGVEINFPGESV